MARPVAARPVSILLSLFLLIISFFPPSASHFCPLPPSFPFLLFILLSFLPISNFVEDPGTRPSQTRIRARKIRSWTRPGPDGTASGGPACLHPPVPPPHHLLLPPSASPFCPLPPSFFPFLLFILLSFFPISNFVEDSFSSDDFQNLQIVTGVNTKDNAFGVLEYKCSADNLSASLPSARQNRSFNLDAPVPARAQSKCSRTAACNWSSRLVVPLT